MLSLRTCRWVALALAAAGAAPRYAAASDGERAIAFDAASLEFFESRIRPVLAARCQGCHGAEKQEGGLRLDSREAVLAGGDTGPAIAPRRPDESLLVDAIRYGELYQMPPKQPLPAEEVALLVEWVERGAPWPAGEVAPAGAVDGKDFDLESRKQAHWAWKPLAAPVPPPAPPGGEAATAIDAFLLAKLDEAGIERAPPADGPALLRRVTFDLTGLPPTPEELAALEADRSAAAWERVVDRLLASPRFGERWARHWLDLVRYSETLGHEFDYPLVQPWRYRDYVIRALNADVPYDQFVREHIAGDLVDPPRRHPVEGYNESIIGTAFWFFGEQLHAPVDSRADYDARIDNQVDVLSKTFLGLTVACARCHDHKFDAISTKDYYALAGYAASSHQQEALLDPGRRIEKAASELTAIKGRGQELWTAALRGDDAGDYFARCLLASHAAGDTPDAALRREIAAQFSVDASALDRFAAACNEPAAREPGAPLYAWTTLAGPHESDQSLLTRRSALEAALSQRSQAATASRQSETVFEDFSAGFGKWYPTGWAFGDRPTRGGDWAPEATSPRLLPAGVAHSGRLGDRLQGVIRSEKFTIEKPYVLYRLAGRNARVRLVVDGYMMDKFTELLFEGLSFNVNTDGEFRWHSQSVARHVGHRAHIELIDPGDGWLAVDEIRFAAAPAVESLDESVTSLVLAQPGVSSAKTLAEAYSNVWRQALDEWRAGKATPGVELVRWAVDKDLAPVDPPSKAELAELAVRVAAIDASLPEPDRVVAIADGSGEDQRVHIRGNYKTLGELAPRALPQAIGGALQPAPARGSGRLELAERLLAPSNPLPARVMANRVWQHLFGRGLAATVDNFGVLGEPPTHPELLDYLATRFRDEGWSIKKLIREIVLTEAYRMAISGDPAANERDPLNLLWHRAMVRRLEGEAIRDALLAISGRLDETRFGPPVPVHLTAFMEGRGRPERSGPLDGDGRRSIYLEVRRNFLSPFMLAFDTPPPASTVGRRNDSNVPAQALVLMNDPLVLQQCKLWAGRMLADGKLTDQRRIERLYLEAFCRAPSTVEAAAAAEFVAEQANAYGAGLDDERPWADLCHVLVNVKEFIYLP